MDGRPTGSAQAAAPVGLSYPLSPDPARARRLFSRSEVIAALSHALDLTEGQPVGHTLRTCAIGMRFAEELDLDDEARSALFFALLLKDAGCSANSAQVADRFGSDDHEVKRDMKTTNWTRIGPGTRYAWRNAARNGTLLLRFRHFMRIAKGEDGGARELIRLRCERGGDIVARLGFPHATAEAIRNLDEQWGGAGHPNGIAGEEIPLLARIAGIAQTIEVFFTDLGLSATLRMLQERRGNWFEPRLVDIALGWKRDAQWWATLHSPDIADRVLAAEPGDDRSQLDDDGLDRIAEAFAEIIDAKSPYTFHHSSGVAGYARRIVEQLDLGPDEERRMYRAGLLHDIGKLGVSNRILDKPGRLTPEERRAIERHAQHTWDILRRVRAFQEFAWTAALHHERLDGSGYPWGFDGDALDLPARVLAVADVYEALTADRPYRAGMPQERVFGILNEEAGTVVDRACVDALMAALQTD